jgi:hypothetical protein
VRNSSTAAVTRAACAGANPAASEAVRPASTTPAPPGVTGSTDSSRVNANAARDACQETSAWGSPLARRHASRTSQSARWLATVVAVMRSPRRPSRPAAPARNSSSSPPARRGGGRRASRHPAVTSRASTWSARRANGALRSVARTTAASRMRTAAPARAAARDAAGEWPVAMSTARATTGRPSRTNTFQSPDTSV